jgi:hypothetical protein
MAAVEVSTVDAFQGREKRFMIVSCVRTKTPSNMLANLRARDGHKAKLPEGATFGGSVGFLRDSRRVNVGLSRGREGLLVVCDVHTLAKVPEWRPALTSIAEKGIWTEVGDGPIPEAEAVMSGMNLAKIAAFKCDVCTSQPQHRGPPPPGPPGSAMPPPPRPQQQHPHPHAPPPQQHPPHGGPHQGGRPYTPGPHHGPPPPHHGHAYPAPGRPPQGYPAPGPGYQQQQQYGGPQQHQRYPHNNQHHNNHHHNNNNSNRPWKGKPQGGGPRPGQGGYQGPKH